MSIEQIYIKHKTVALAPIKFEHLWNCKEKEEPNHLKCKLCFKELETKSVHLNLQPSVHFNSFWHMDKWREGANKPKCNAAKKTLGLMNSHCLWDLWQEYTILWVKNAHRADTADITLMMQTHFKHKIFSLFLLLQNSIKKIQQKYYPLSERKISTSWSYVTQDLHHLYLPLF